MTDRTPTKLDALADDYLNRAVALDPLEATMIGIPGYDHLMPDYSPDGWAALAELNREVLAKLTEVPIADDVDKVTHAAMQERIGLRLELHEAQEDLADLNNIASPLQSIRDIFDLMPTETTEQWETIAQRMRRVPETTASYLTSLRAAKIRPAKRQFEIGAEQAAGYARPEGFWSTFAASAKAKDGELPDSLRAELLKAADSARAAYGELAQQLRELIPTGAETDAVGRERYGQLSRLFLGATVDFDETYAWGQEELDRIVAEQQEVARQIGGAGTSVEEAIEILNNDPTRKLHGTEALQRWMQETSDSAVAALGKEQFDIPEPVRTLECCIAPTSTGGIYYTGPSDDFSRPGRMWWSVPEGVTEFTTWLEKTTVYHEGVPGHHLQIGQTTYRSGLLNSWRRHGTWVSGHGEGWALYAERLMRDLGYLDDPGDYLGMLDGQRMRAARVVLDLGVHLDLPHPDGGKWDYNRAWDFLKANAGAEEGFLRFELNRYLGWPGQAPSYKIGQRIWEQIRDELAAREGADFDLKRFHRRALDLGSVGLDVLREALLS